MLALIGRPIFNPVGSRSIVGRDPRHEPASRTPPDPDETVDDTLETCPCCGDSLGDTERVTPSTTITGALRTEQRTSGDMTQPNVLTIITHDMGQHLGCYGIDTVRTPNIDRLADEGVRFENAFCTSPQCSPSRAALATGRYPHNNGVMGLTHSHFDWDLNPDEQHLSVLLSDAGFHTSLVGGLHETQDQTALVDTELGGVFDHPEQQGQRTAKFLHDTSRDEPFYHHLSIGRPHRDISSPSGWGPMPDDYTPEATIPPYLQDSVRTEKAFGAMEGSIHRVDNAVGIVLDALEETGQLENTIVTMTTDHGIPFPRAKCSPYDPGIEISLIMRWPERFKQGAVIDELVSNVDHLPTLCELLDIPSPDGVQGNSFVPLLTGSGEHTPRTEVFGEMTFHDYCDPRRWIRTENYKLIANFTHAPFFMDPTNLWERDSVTKDPRYPDRVHHPPFELYDLREDSLETENRFDDPDYATIQNDLVNQLTEWLVATNDPILDGIPTPPIHETVTQELNPDR